MDWRDLQTFLATAEAGSTQAAAGELGLDQSTVSRRIAAFEKRMGQRFFDRLPSGLELTSAGSVMLETARRVESEIHALERRVIGDSPDLEGEVRLSAPPLYLAEYLGTVLQQFHQRYPDVHIDLDVTTGEANLTKREADIAVRGSNTPPEHLIGRQVATLHVTLYAAAEIADQGLDLPWIGWGEPGELEDWATHRDLRISRRLWRADTPDAQLNLARRGMGIAILPCSIGDLDPGLKRICGDRSWPSREIWVLTHRDLIAAPRIRTLFNFLADGLREQADLIEGRQPG